MKRIEVDDFDDTGTNDTDRDDVGGNLCHLIKPHDDVFLLWNSSEGVPLPPPRVFFHLWRRVGIIDKAWQGDSNVLHSIPKQEAHTVTQPELLTSIFPTECGLVQTFR